MTLLTTSVVLSLVWFATVNLLVSAGVWAVARGLLSRGVQLRPGSLLLLRLAPASAAVVFVGTVFLPAHWLFESPGTPEAFGFILLTLTATTIALAMRALIRAVLAVVQSTYLRRSLQSRPMSTVNHGRAAEALEEVNGLNGLSLAGIISTKILVGTTTRQALTDAELEVAIAHEQAHRRAWDNLKKFVVFCTPDVLGLTEGGRRLERAWNAATECQADAQAVAGDPARAVNLASALVKVARLVDTSSGRHVGSIVWSTFHQPGLLETRVRRLVEGASAPGAVRLPIVSLAASSMAVTLAVLWLANVPHDIYRLTEALIRLLP